MKVHEGMKPVRFDVNCAIRELGVKFCLGEDMLADQVRQFFDGFSRSIRKMTCLRLTWVSPSIWRVCSLRLQEKVQMMLRVVVLLRRTPVFPTRTL